MNKYTVYMEGIYTSRDTGETTKRTIKLADYAGPKTSIKRLDKALHDHEAETEEFVAVKFTQSCVASIVIEKSKPFPPYAALVMFNIGLSSSCPNGVTFVAVGDQGKKSIFSIPVGNAYSQSEKK